MNTINIVILSIKNKLYTLGGKLGIGRNDTKSQHLLMREYRIYAVYVLHTVFN